MMPLSHGLTIKPALFRIRLHRIAAVSSALPKLCSGILVLGLAGMASARLPPPTEAQQQVVAEKKTATAAAAEKAKQELARAQDRAVDAYHANQNRKTATGQHQPGSGAGTK